MSVKAPTPAQKERLDKLSRAGCVVCRLQHGAYVDAEIQHLTSGGRRLGHDFTIPLCAWHHRGVCVGRYNQAQMTELYGPSFAKSRAAFETAFGSEEQLLEATNSWLGCQKKIVSHSATSPPSQPSTTADSAPTARK